MPPNPAPRVALPQPPAPPDVLSADDVPDDVLGAEILYRRAAEPLRLYWPGPGTRESAFASTIRGVLFVSGGTRAGKTIGIGAPKTAAVAEGIHRELACPEGCKQRGVGSCGLHCCPTVARGSADFSEKGCVAPRAEYCPVHPPLHYDAQPRFILVGCLDLAKFWDVTYGDGLRHYLSRNADGTPQWVEDRQHNRLIHREGRYIIQAAPYDKPNRVESYNPCFIWDDECPEYKIFRYQIPRRLSQDSQILVTATAFGLIDGTHQWVQTEVEQRKRLVSAKTQVIEIDSRDNVFLDPPARQAILDYSAELKMRGRDQEHAIRVEGKIVARSDNAIFSQDTIDKQARFILEPKNAYVIVGEPAGDALSEPRRPRRGSADYMPRIVWERPPEMFGTHVLYVWEMPDPTHRYVSGSDVAGEGPHGDYHVTSVFDVTTGNQVAQYRGHGRDAVYAGVIYAIWTAYRPFMVVERNTFGEAIINRLLYEYRIPHGDFFKRLDRRDRAPSGAPIPQVGFQLTRGSKGIGGSSLQTAFGPMGTPLSIYEDALRSGHVILRSQQSWLELQTFISDQGKLGAIEGAYDDCVIADAYAVFGMRVMESRGLLDAPPPAVTQALTPRELDKLINQAPPAYELELRRNPTDRPWAVPERTQARRRPRSAALTRRAVRFR